MIRIPYGESDFQKLMDGKYFYQDRTEFIGKLEKWNSSYPVFLRPRRFGKSLFVSMLQCYYGLEYKESFETLFGHLYIGRNPTALANAYMILRFDFSRIDTATHESTYKGFLSNVEYGTHMFLAAYPQFFSEADRQFIFLEQSPEGILKGIFKKVVSNRLAHKIYVLVDEYDQFANELLSFDMDRFKSDVSRNGFVRKFYETLKTATGEGIVGRIFITGVSPVTMDSMTSGFNISSNISLNPLFHDMMGFTHSEVEGILDEADIPAEKIPAMMSDLTDWYDGYLFANDIVSPLFNPDMVLYFLQGYGIKGTYPAKMLDPNIVSDYGKIRNLFRIGGSETEKFGLLERLVETGAISFSLTEIFSFERPFMQEDFLSLLYYMGMLTVGEVRNMRWQFRIPNYVIKKLYFEYFASIFLAKTQFANTRIPLEDAIDALGNEANPEPFFKAVAHVLTKNHSNRDRMHYGEKHLQTLMIGMLHFYNAYYIRSEYAVGTGYADIFLEKMPDRPINYEIVLELKYVKKAAKATLPDVAAEARTQLAGYMRSERFSRPDVRGFYVVFLGGEVYEWSMVTG